MPRLHCQKFSPATWCFSATCLFTSGVRHCRANRLRSLSMAVLLVRPPTGLAAGASTCRHSLPVAPSPSPCAPLTPFSSTTSFSEIFGLHPVSRIWRCLWQDSPEPSSKTPKRRLPLPTTQRSACFTWHRTLRTIPLKTSKVRRDGRSAHLKLRAPSPPQPTSLLAISSNIRRSP